ncbi:hypothetical protein [Methylorubrum extorquens]|uniref:Uncharacterized protein n=1 Tax=Methylorubrum extorquens (strain CM4 / NCIMB 13688) TaxID=440085 RepID=B7KWP9_METC4|nr:hypothetical protein [Methylorubrum extorquens]ACK86126.1 hypothetical protein Mchl_5368 [Methylorubrum extorquens CM4]
MLPLNIISAFPAQAATRQSINAPVSPPHTCVPAPANDDLADYLDRELADLPLDFSDVPPAPIVSNLDGSPAEPEPAPVPSVPDLVTRAAARPRRKRRRSGLRQREDARRMRAHRRADAEEVVNHLPTPANTNTKTSKTTPTETKPKAITRRIASWDDAGELPRVIAMNRALDRFGVPMAFSVNFDPRFIKAANDNARGQLDYYRRRIAMALKRAVGETPAMWIAVETDDDGRQHCHGGMARTDRHDPAVVLDALAQAGGNWTTQGSAPADLRPQHAPDGWAIYPFKRAPRTRRDLREAAGLDAAARVTLYSCTDDLRTEAKRVYEEARRAIGSGDRTHERGRTARELVQEARQRAATLEAPETAPVLPEPPCEPAVIPVPASGAGAAAQARPAQTELLAELAFTVPTPLALDGPFRMPATARSRGPPRADHLVST